MKPKAWIVGVGPGSPEYLTKAATDAIRSSDAILGWDLDILPVKALLEGKKVYLQDVSNYVEATQVAARECLQNGADIAIVRIGDPCVSSGLSGILEIFREFDIHVVPGISSTQFAAAYAQINIDESVIISFHDYGNPDEKKEFMLDAFKRLRHIIILCSPDMRPAAAAKFFVEKELEATTIGYVLSRVTLPEQSIFKASLSEIAEREFDWLSVFVLPNPNVPDSLRARQIWEEWGSSHGQQNSDNPRAQCA